MGINGDVFSHGQCLGRILVKILGFPSCYLLWYLGFSFTKLECVLYVPLNRLVIFLKSWISTSYFSYSTDSSVTCGRFSPFNAHGVVIFDAKDSFGWSESKILMTKVNIPNNYHCPLHDQNPNSIRIGVERYLSFIYFLFFIFEFNLILISFFQSIELVYNVSLCFHPPPWQVSQNFIRILTRCSNIPITCTCLWVTNLGTQVLK